MKKNYCTHSSSHAFSLVEVLVSITILLLVVVTPMSIVTRANNSTAFANEQMVAFFLAQEGLELIEKRRNDFYLEYFERQFTGAGGVTDPMTRFSDTTGTAPLRACYTSSGCGLRLFMGTSDVFGFSCAAAGACRIYQIDNRYVQAGSQPVGSVVTPYTRVIRMTSTTAAGKLQDVRVVSTVTWRTGSLIAGQQVELVTYLSNMYDTN